MHCLGHNFEFDLATGECRNARCDPLPVREVEPAYSCRSASPTTNSPVSTT
jgi:UDP-MurNAc hydroxylase